VGSNRNGCGGVVDAHSSIMGGQVIGRGSFVWDIGGGAGGGRQIVSNVLAESIRSDGVGNGLFLSCGGAMSHRSLSLLVLVLFCPL
jgi:hypothetical protein